MRAVGGGGETRMSLQQDGAALDEPGRWREVQGLLWGGVRRRSGLGPDTRAQLLLQAGRRPWRLKGGADGTGPASTPTGKEPFPPGDQEGSSRW